MQEYRNAGWQVAEETMSWLCECQYKNLGQWLKCHACGNRKPIARASRAMIANRFGDLQIKPKYEYTIDFKTFGEYSIDEWYSMLASNRISKPLRKAIRFKINVHKHDMMLECRKLHKDILCAHARYVATLTSRNRS